MIVAAKPLVVLLLTETWINAVPFVQILCVSYFFRPITISNWEAIKALGYSDITLKLEMLKKIIDIAILVVTAMIGVYAIAIGQVIFNLICVFINLAPNKKLLNYGIKEQLVDAVPTLLIALAAGFIAYWVQLLPIHNFWIILIQFLVGGAVYIGLSHLFKEESYFYIRQMVKDNKNKLHLK